MDKRSERDYEAEIDLKQIMYVIMDKAKIIVLVGIIAALAMFLYSKFFIVPQYSSRATVYIVNKVNSDGTTTYQDTLSAGYLATDFEQMIKTRKVLEEVIANLGLKCSVGSLGSKVSVDVADSSRILYVTVTDSDPYEAKRIVKEMVSVARQNSSDMMDVGDVRIWDSGSVSNSPISPNIKKNVFLAFAASVFGAIAIILVRYALDDTFKRPEDVEKKLGLSVLGSIPYEVNKKKSRLKLRQR